MKLQFNVEYQVAAGEELVLNWLAEDGSTSGRQFMYSSDGCHWSCDVEHPMPTGSYCDYYYSVVRGQEVRRTEWLMEPHRLEAAAGKGRRYRVYDRWLDIPEDAYMYTSAFTDCVMARKRSLSPETEYQQTVRLKARAPQLRNGQRLAVVGSLECLGSWDVLKAVVMTEHQSHEWVVSLDASQLGQDTFEYKLIIVNDDSNDYPDWEEGPNRLLTVPQLNDGDVIVYELTQASFPVHPWRGAGVVVPVFSLRSEGSFGVGDFGDLKQLVDWADKTLLHVIQVLPINDTNMTGQWQDSYPYNAISIYALHPQYTDFRQLPVLKDEKQREKYEQLRQELNALTQIDYERMFRAKMGYLRELFKQEWPTVSRRKTYKDFFRHNQHWLEPYAAFCYYRDKYRTAVFSQWPEGSTVEALLSKTTAQVKKELDFWYFVQYNLDQQMRAAHEYARKKRVILKGDIPIGISRDGVEAWVEPRYFNMNGQAGAPPDFFTRDGQNWGFPTYNWDEMLKDGCQWWVRRFRKMAEYFDAYRIDHILGFFRIWEIPVPEKSGLWGQFQPSLGLSREEIENYGIHGHDELFLVDHKRSDRWHPRIAIQYEEEYERLSQGEKDCFNRLYNDYFYRRNTQYWYQEAMKKLPRLTQATHMLCCAEDLGMVPECVPWVMDELRILSLEIQTMPKHDSRRFGRLKYNPYRSVCTISTHDMPTLRQWWDEDDERTQEYYTTILHRAEPAPHPLPGWLASDIISRHLLSRSMLCLLSLQDWLAISDELRLPDANAERINIPANPRHYWRYRMHLNIDDMIKADDFNQAIRSLIIQSARHS